MYRNLNYRREVCLVEKGIVGMVSLVEDYIKTREEIAKKIEYSQLEDIQNEVQLITTSDVIIKYFTALQHRIQYQFDRAIEILNSIEYTEVPFSLEFPLTVELSYSKWMLYRNSTTIPSIDKSVEIYNQLKPNHKELFREEYATLRHVLGNRQAVKGEFLNALQNFLDALEIRLDLDRPVSKAMSYHNIALIYHNFGDLKEAEEKNKMAFKLLSGVSSQKSLAFVLHTMGKIYLGKGQFTDAIHYLNLARDFKSDINDTFGVLSAYCDLIRIYLVKENNDKVERYKQMAQELAESVDDNKHTDFYRLIEAMILKSKKRIKYKADAERLFEELSESSYLDYDRKVLAMLNLADIYAEELSIYGERSVFEDLSDIVSNLVETAKRKAMYAVFIDCLILEAKLFLFNEEYEQAVKALNDAEEEAMKLGLDRYKSIVNEHKENMLDRLEKMKITLGKNKSLLKEIESEEISDYLRSILNVVEKVESGSDLENI